jgi:glutathione S-transferase
MSTTPTDPLAMFRDMVNQWEKLANDYGSQFLQRPEAAQAMHGATTAGLQIQGAIQDAMAKVLAAANMPSKAEVEALGARLTAVEAALWRIEAKLGAEVPPAAAAAPAAQKPTRGRKPKSDE